MAKNPKAPTGPYNPGPGTGHEIGVMVAFILAFVVVTALYMVMWKAGNRREERTEIQRRQMLREKAINARNSKVIGVQEAYRDEVDSKDAVRQDSRPSS